MRPSAALGGEKANPTSLGKAPKNLKKTIIFFAFSHAWLGERVYNVPAALLRKANLHHKNRGLWHLTR